MISSQTLIFVIGIIFTIFYVYVSEKNKRRNNINIDESIKNKLGNKNATSKEVKMAYKYETGNSTFFNNHRDGTSLEYEVFKKLYRYEGKVLADLYIPKGNRTTQIDIVFLHSTGIYIVECKDIRAMEISGTEYDTHWNCKYDNKFKRQIYNPLKQNVNHVLALKELLGDKYTLDNFASVVTINCNNVNAKYGNGIGSFTQRVVTPRELEQHIKELIENRKEIFSDSEILNLYNDLHEKYSNVSNEIKDKHIKQIKTITSQVQFK